MRFYRLRRGLTVAALLALPVLAHAQDATLSGTVTDTTGGALPGVTVRAVHDASGNSFEGVTDERGAYRLSVRVGAYKVTAELAGFAPVTRAVTLLIGQEAVMDLRMGVSGLEETVTVTGEAPLLDVTQSRMGGNIDSRQMQDLPVQGRNWVDLTLLAPGARENAVGSQPAVESVGGRQVMGNFELNIDGQQVTQLQSAQIGLAARFSSEAIAEFEYVASRFDATQGRSTGLQVNAITKSGTNAFLGSFASHFRHDRFNAADPVVKQVLPYENQQAVGTFGGPIRKDKLHFFAHYEYERQPATSVWTTPYPSFNLTLTGTQREDKGGVRLDAQFSPQTRLAVRLTRYRQERQAGSGGGGSATTTPSGGNSHEGSDQVVATLTQVLSNRAVNEIKVGSAAIQRDTGSRITNPNAHVRLGSVLGDGAVIVRLRGLQTGGVVRFPQEAYTDTYSVRDDLTYSVGGHTMKLGAEWLHQKVLDIRCQFCDGELTATRGPIPANIESLFPNLSDASTWNLAPLSRISTQWRQHFSSTLRANGAGRDSYAGWLQDDWTVTPRLMLNLGVRYDLEINAFHNKVEILPFIPGNRPDDKNNAAARTGFTFRLNDRTVARGGYGRFYGTTVSAYMMEHMVNGFDLTVQNDGRPDFASNPWSGPEPSFESILARLCTPALKPGCLTRNITTDGGATIFPPGFTMPYSHQASIGLQRQVADTMAVEADYVYVGNRDLPSDQMANLTYDPATGANYPWTDVSRRPWPEWGTVRLFFNGSRANRHSLQTALTKRMSNGWQASGTYTLSVARDANAPPRSGLDLVPFPTAPDMGGEYGLSVGDQRHRAVLNGIWQLGYGFQVSGLYFFGSGQRYQTVWSPNVDVRQMGSASFTESRFRPDGTIIPRNSFVGHPIHRVDLRLQQRVPLAGRVRIDGMLDIFNVFNHANYGSYVIQQISSSYGKPEQNGNVAYTPRTLQLGFRMTF